MSNIQQVKSHGSVDLKVGIIAHREIYEVPTLLDAVRWVPDPMPIDIPMVMRNYEQRPDGGYDLTLNFEGHLTPSEAGSDEDYSLDGTLSQDPIERHENLEKLMKLFGGKIKPGDPSRVVFESSLTVNGEKKPNPMFGVEVYDSPGLVWTRTRALQQFPDALVNQLGTICDPPSGPNGQPPGLTGKRNWFMLRIDAKWRGNVWKLSDSYLLSPPGGHNEYLYGRQ